MDKELLDVLAFREIALRYLPRCGPMHEDQALTMIELICSVDAEVLWHRRSESLRLFACCFVDDAYYRVIVELSPRKSCKEVREWISMKAKTLS